MILIYLQNSADTEEQTILMEIHNILRTVISIVIITLIDVTYIVYTLVKTEKLQNV